MDLTTTLILIILGILILCIIIFGIIVLILWNRRKLIFTKFLDKDGKWKEISHYKIENTFEYDNEIYEFDIKKCTRDKYNRPIAHYYKGNPKQQIFDYNENKKVIQIGTENINNKDFLNILKTKIISEIFADEEISKMLNIILISIIASALIIMLLIFFVNPAVKIANNNENLNLIAQGCKMAFNTGV